MKWSCRRALWLALPGLTAVLASGCDVEVPDARIFGVWSSRNGWPGDPATCGGASLDGVPGASWKATLIVDCTWPVGTPPPITDGPIYGCAPNAQGLDLCQSMRSSFEQLGATCALRLETGCCNPRPFASTTPGWNFRPLCAIGSFPPDPTLRLGPDGGVLPPEPPPDGGPCVVPHDPALVSLGFVGDECYELTPDGVPQEGRYTCPAGAAEPVCTIGNRDLLHEMYQHVTADTAAAALPDALVEYEAATPPCPNPAMPCGGDGPAQREIGLVYEDFFDNVMEPRWRPLYTSQYRYVVPEPVTYAPGSGQDGHRHPAFDQIDNDWESASPAGVSRYADAVVFSASHGYPEVIYELKCPDVINNNRLWPLREKAYWALAEVNNGKQLLSYQAWLRSLQRMGVGAVVDYRFCQGITQPWLLMLTTLGCADNAIGNCGWDIDPIARWFEWSHKTICGPRNAQQIQQWLAIAQRVWWEFEAQQCGSCADGDHDCWLNCILLYAGAWWDLCKGGEAMLFTNTGRGFA